MSGKRTVYSLGSKPYASPYYSIGREICHNMFLEFAQAEEAKNKYYLLKIPGMRRMLPPSSSLGGCRYMNTFGNGRTFGVWGSTFGEVLYDGTIAEIGTLLSTTGIVSMADNGYQLMLVDGFNGWIYDYQTGNFSVISDEYFPGNAAGTRAPTHVGYLDTYFIVNVADSDTYYWSEPYYKNTDGSDYSPSVPNGYWDPVNSGKKIGRPDNITALAVCNNYLWLFGANSNEIHYDTGDYNGQLFARYEGAILNFGCNAKNSVAVINNNVFWLASDTTGTIGVFTNEGVQPKRVSTVGIEQIIQEFSKYTDAVGYAYSQLSHTFYVLQFPTANRTFVYDLVTDSWHERTLLDSSSGRLQMYPAMFCTRNYDMTICGHISHSAVFELDPLYYQNDNPGDTGVTYIRCAKNTPILFAAGNMARYDQVQIVCNQGYGTSVNTPAGVGKSPRVFLSYSNDTGVTWSNTREAPLGEMGDYSKRSVILGLGAGRNRVFLVTMTDPVPFILVSLILFGEEFNS